MCSETSILHETDNAISISDRVIGNADFRVCSICVQFCVRSIDSCDNTLVRAQHTHVFFLCFGDQIVQCTELDG